jgi:hypothetical protein
MIKDKKLDFTILAFVIFVMILAGLDVYGYVRECVMVVEITSLFIGGIIGSLTMGLLAGSRRDWDS